MSSNHIVCRLCLSEIEEENISLFSVYQNVEYKEIAKALANLNVIFFFSKLFENLFLLFIN